jgi:hypothetical protein
MVAGVVVLVLAAMFALSTAVALFHPDGKRRAEARDTL